MSRHRNVRNLTEDDYYYDDYDDDNDDDEDCEDYQDEYTYRRPAEPSPTPLVATRTTTTTTTPPPKQQQQQQHPVSMPEKVRYLQEVGFTTAQAKTALGETKGNVEQAMELLLNLNTATATGGGPTTTTTTTTTTGGGTGTSFRKPPPPGFLEKPKTTPSTTTTTPTTTTITTPTPSKLSTTTTNPTTTAKPTPTIPGEDGLPPPPPLPLVGSTHPHQPLPRSTVQEINHNRKSQLAMIVLGHVDAGKSTLMGQVLYQLGHVPKRTLEKYQKQATELGKPSFALAWIMDEDALERQRGITMELATKFVSTTNHEFVILDAPGHADFVPCMIAGAASADVGLLVVAATRGEFEAGFGKTTTTPTTQQPTTTTTSTSTGGQTREHVVLARGLGVSQLLVAVNKLDAVEWNPTRFQEIQHMLLPFITSQGFSPKRIRFVPVSGLNGENVKTRSNPALMEWYHGPTLLEAMDSFVPAPRNIDKPLRAIVMDVYVEGRNVTSTCRVVQGVVQTGDKLVVLPFGEEAVVSRIEHGTTTTAMDDDHTAAAVETNRLAMAGDTVDIILTGIDVARIPMGCVLSHAGGGGGGDSRSRRPPISHQLRAKIVVLDPLHVPILRGSQVLLHMHSIDVPAVISKLICSTTKQRKEDGIETTWNPRVLTGGTSATVEISLSEKICLERFVDCRALGRFVLRRGGDSIAVGIIEEVL